MVLQSASSGLNTLDVQEREISLCSPPVPPGRWGQGEGGPSLLYNAVGAKGCATAQPNLSVLLTWLILPASVCFSQGLSHARVRASCEPLPNLSANGSLNQRQSQQGVCNSFSTEGWSSCAVPPFLVFPPCARGAPPLVRGHREGGGFGPLAPGPPSGGHPLFLKQGANTM